MRIEGGKELARKLKSIDDDLRRKVGRAAVREAAKVVREETEVQAPPPATAPHHIRDSIKFTKVEETSHSWMYAVRISKNTFYWQFLEFGTSKMPARPFFRPAFEKSAPEALRVMIGTLRQDLITKRVF